MDTTCGDWKHMQHPWSSGECQPASGYRGEKTERSPEGTSPAQVLALKRTQRTSKRGASTHASCFAAPRGPTCGLWGEEAKRSCVPAGNQHRQEQQKQDTEVRETENHYPPSQGATCKDRFSCKRTDALDARDNSFPSTVLK